MTESLFLYGTLRDPELFEVAAGVGLRARPARLADHRAVWARGENFPLIIEDAGRTADGLLVEVGEAEKARLDFYELGFRYTIRPVEVTVQDGHLKALVYFPDPGIWDEGEAWSLAEWQAGFGREAREAAREYMRLYGRLDAAAAARAFPQIRMRAASRMRALETPSPAPLAPAMDIGAVRVIETRQPYIDYFAVREDDLSFPTFSGEQSETVTRTSFLGGDAVTVLPYDPLRDEVLVVRQFRHGAFVRGDVNPWSMEPAAGRMDPGETPDETARRELLEETGLVAERLHKVAEYYPSPGAYSEFLTSYIAVTDLSGRDGATAGQSEEAEDIMSHVIGFEAMMEMIDTGAANTGPLVLSLLWLARNRATLRPSD